MLGSRAPVHSALYSQQLLYRWLSLSEQPFHLGFSDLVGLRVSHYRIGNGTEERAPGLITAGWPQDTCHYTILLHPRSIERRRCVTFSNTSDESEGQMIDGRSQINMQQNGKTEVQVAVIQLQ